MRVLHIITGLQVGGAEAMLAKVVGALPSPRHRHIVLPLLDGGALAPRLLAAGAEILALNAPQSARAAFSLARLRDVARHARADVVQGWMYHGNLAASLASTGQPMLWNVRQTLARLRDTRLLTRAVILGCIPFASSVRQVIYNAAEAAAQHERLGYPAAKRRLIPNGFDTNLFRPRRDAAAALRTALGLPPTARIVGRVARDAPMKDHATLFAAFARIAAAAPTAHLVCVGQGMVAGAPELEGLIAEQRLMGRVHLLGERLDIEMVTAGFDIALSTSGHSEGFSNAIGEAMATAVPVVATDVGEAHLILGDDSRILPPRDAAGIGARAISLLAMPTEGLAAIGAADRLRVIAHYGLHRIAEHYAHAWQDAVAGRPVHHKPATIPHGISQMEAPRPARTVRGAARSDL